MAEDLGDRLVQAGLVAHAQLAEVLAEAPPHEGALVRGLVGAGLSEDGLVGFFVASGFGPLLEPADLAAAEPEAVARVPGSVAMQLLALPIRSSMAGLIVAMAAPTDTHALGELARLARSDVLATVARVGDLIEALERAYPGTRRSAVPTERESEPPVLELVNVRKKGRAVAPEGFLGSTKGAERVEARATVGPRLVAEDSEAFVPLVRTKPVAPPTAPSAETSLDRKIVTRDFEALPKQPRVVPVGAPTKSAPPTAGAPAKGTPTRARPARGATPKAAATKERWAAGRALRPPSGVPSAEAPVARRSAPAPTPPKDPSPAPEVASAAAQNHVELDGLASMDTELEIDIVETPATIIPKEHAEWGSLDSPENKIDPDKIARVRESRPPRSAAKIPEIGGTLAAMRAARDRDEVVTLACQGALTVSRAAVLLALRKTVLKGWGGAGAGVSMDAVRNLWIPTSSPSMFRDVVARLEPYHGSPGTAAADGLFRATLGSRGGPVSVHPVLVGSKLVGVLAADDMRFGEDGRDRIETIARAASEALERIIVDSKKR